MGLGNVDNLVVHLSEACHILAVGHNHAFHMEDSRHRQQGVGDCMNDQAAPSELHACFLTPCVVAPSQAAYDTGFEKFE